MVWTQFSYWQLEVSSHIEIDLGLFVNTEFSNDGSMRDQFSGMLAPSMIADW